MIKNYIKIALRSLARNKIYGVISVFGLAVGIAGAAFLYFYIDNELSYDRFHDKSERIYRLVEISENSGQTRYFGQTAPVLGATLEETFPEVQNMVRVYQPSGHVDMVRNGERIHERSYLLADPDFFDVFDFEIIRGNSANPLGEPNSLVLSERKAGELFGDENPVGQVLTFNNLGEVTVTAVMENVPDNSHLQFEMAFSRQNSNLDWENYLSSWEVYGAYTYLLLGESADMPSFRNKLDTFIPEQKAANENARNFYLQPVTDIYFNSGQVEFGIESAHGNSTYIYLFSAIGIFLLLIAGFNYMNLATALSARRGREIGIRKAAGAEKKQLIAQFLSESVVITLFAGLCAFLLIVFGMPWFNQLTGKSFAMTPDMIGYAAAVLLGIALFLGIASGSYPAFYLALIEPIRVLKSKMDLKKGNLTLRKVLIVAQFSLSMILIIATLAVYKQMNYIRSADLGFDKEQTVVVDINHGNVRSRFETMKQEIRKIPGVLDVAVSSRVPGEWKSIIQVFARPVDTGAQDSLQTYFMSFDEDMAGLYDMRLTAGSNFTGNKQADSLTVLLNETAVRELNLDNPVGAYLEISGSGEPVKVAGVLEDFHYQSLHQKVAPLIIGYWANPVRAIDYFSIKLAGGDISEALAGIKEVHGRFDPETAMEYHFLDDQIEQKYRADIRAGRLFAIGGGVTIFIACMGLFGLALFATETRMKEVGIRKVLGATVPGILLLLASDFLKMVLIAFVLAVPVAWVVMSNWLQNFAYSTGLGIGIFLLTGVGVLVVSLLTVSYQSARAAMTNPVNSLRSE